MCKWNEVLDTDKCHRIDESKGRSPYRQGEILRSIFTFNQAGIITSSSLVDLTCRNTWCVTDWRKRPKASDPEIKSAISVQEHVLSEKGSPSPLFQDLASVQANIVPSFSAHNVDGGVCSVGSCFHNKHQLSLYSGTHPPTCPSNRSRKHVGYSEARQFSSCRFGVRNQPTVIGNKLNAFADQERHISLSRYTALHDIRNSNLMPHYISNVDYNQSVQQYQHGVPNTTHQVTAWYNYAQIPRDYARELLHQPVLQLTESPLSSVPADVHTEMPSSSEILKTSAQTPDFTSKAIETNTESRLEKTDLCITSRRFECPHCCFKCSNRGQLTGHIRGHTGKNYVEAGFWVKRMSQGEIAKEIQNDECFC